MADLLNRTALDNAIDNLLTNSAVNGSITPLLHNQLLKDILDTLINSLINSIFSANGTIGTARIASLTDTLTFKAIGLTNGQRNLIIKDGNNDYILENFDNGYFKRTIRSGFNLGVISNTAGTQGLWLQTVSELAGAGGLLIKNNKADINCLKYFTDNFKAPDAQWYSNGQIHHRIRSNGTSSTVLSQVSFFINGFYGFGFNVGANAPISTEDISLQGSTVIKGNGTSTGITLALYDNDTTPQKNFEFLDNSTLKGYNNAKIEDVIIKPKIQEVTTSTSFTIDSNSESLGILTSIASNLIINAPTGSPSQGQKLMIRLKDNGTSRTLTFNSIWRSIGVTLPTATTPNKTIYIGAIYNSTDTKWDVIAIKEES